MEEDEPVEDYWEDREAAKKINGIYANRIFVQPLGDGMVRINLGEVIDEDRSYHTAAVVTAHQAVAFAQIIYSIATSVIEADRQAMAVAAEAAAKFAEEQAEAAAADAARGPGGEEPR